MERDDDGAGRRFEDFARDGMRAFLRMTAKAADSLHVASDRAVERLDLSALERRLTRLYAELGETVYPSFRDGFAPDPSDPEVSRLVSDITATKDEIARKKPIS